MTNEKPPWSIGNPNENKSRAYRGGIIGKALAAQVWESKFEFPEPRKARWNSVCL